MNIEVFGVSDVGMRRERNEDSYLIRKDLGLFVVADGMGGHVGGEFASKLAVKTIDEAFMKTVDTADDPTVDEESGKPEDYAAALRNAIKGASKKIYAEAKKEPSLRGMGTTSVVLLVRKDRVYIANVGDSRAYLIRGGKVLQLTEDHSLVGEQLRAGVISEYAARGHKLKNIITRSVGFQEDVDIDVVVKIPREGDRYLLCSDGLTNMVANDEILDVVSGNSLEEACHILIDMANTRGGEDNITVILSEVTDVGRAGEGELIDDESTIGI